MKNRLSEFWQELRGVRLSKAESEQIFSRINSVRVKGDAGLEGYMDPRSFLRQRAKTIKLTSKEAAEAREQIMHFVDRNPLPEDFGHIPMWSLSDFFRFRFALLRPVPAMVTAIFLFTSATGLSLAAQTALPGDFLYPVKVNFNEQARASFFFTTNSRAHFEAERLEKRLEEAAQLAAARKLEGKLQADVLRRINEQLVLTQQAAAALADIGNHEAALEIHSQIETDLIANSIVLSDILKASGEATVDARKLIQNAADAERSATTARVRSEKKAANHETNALAAAEKNIRLTMERMESAQTYISDKRSQADPGAITQAEARLDFARRMLSTARTKIDAGEYEEAIRLGGEAQRAAMEAKAILRVSLTVKPYLKATR